MQGAPSAPLAPPLPPPTTEQPPTTEPPPAQPPPPPAAEQPLPSACKPPPCKYEAMWAVRELGRLEGWHGVNRAGFLRDVECLRPYAMGGTIDETRWWDLDARAQAEADKTKDENAGDN